ncbi:Gfo/Idh/MocA family protein [Lederbergia galactosidilytica]|uniref:Gfo/Idh/MocA family protein n=1 Tax=Lederbergia galactosidilytica TaxID=217031 RepID=UPI000B0FE3BA|nr:Gfo/Idh/MocA family oxidoreductase [Lederbergia galactosidilytica]MBP1917504.1 putative dehydrogenase [Lederbergia galactosidilytica]
MKELKVGIISFAHGHGFSYANALEEIENVVIAGVADDDSERGRKAATQYGTTFYGTYEKLLAQDIDAVVITSENAHHHEQVLAAAQAKKHILCEKPLATTVEDAWEMIRACEENRVKLQTAFPVRFHASIAQAKQQIEAGKIGRILAIKGTNRGRNPGGWFVDPVLSGGGAVMDHTVHLLDIMRWFMGAEVKEVFAEAGQLFSDVPIDDAGIVTLEFTNGVFATIDCSWSKSAFYPKGGDITLEIVGTDGILQVDAYKQNIQVYSEKMGVARNFWGENMNRGLIEDFIQCIRVEREPSISGLDGLKAVEIALAAYQSSATQQVIEL